MMLRNISIGVRLVAAFLLVVFLFCGVLGLQFSTMSRLGVLQDEGAKRSYDVEALANVRMRVLEVYILYSDAMVSQMVGMATKQLGEISELVAADIRTVSDLSDTEEERTLAKTFGELYQEYLKLGADELLPYLKAHRGDMGSELRALNGRIVQTRKSLLMTLQAILDSFIKENHEADAVFDQVRGQSLRLALVSSGLVLLLALALALGITLSITRPLGRSMRYAVAVAEGDLEQDLELRQKDEVGRLAEALRRMLASLKGMIAEAAEKGRQAEASAKEARDAMASAKAAQAEAELAKAEGQRQAAGQLERVVEVLTSASQELSTQVEQAGKGTDIQAERVGETATAMEQMNATVLEVARNASQAAQTSEQAKRKAEEGESVVRDMVQGIDEINNKAQELKKGMDALSGETENIGRIVGVINDIADQTNLLALNAAIEAARAGEAGRGFAVVADEVRKLAEKTMAATKEVDKAIHGVQLGARTNVSHVEESAALISRTTELANRSGGALREIVNLVDATADQVRNIATASEQQSSSSEEINHAVEAINQISLETSEAMRQSSLAVAELAEQAENLQRLISAMRHE